MKVYNYFVDRQNFMTLPHGTSLPVPPQSDLLTAPLQDVFERNCSRVIVYIYCHKPFFYLQAECSFNIILAPFSSERPL